MNVAKMLKHALGTEKDGTLPMNLMSLGIDEMGGRCFFLRSFDFIFG